MKICVISPFPLTPGKVIGGVEAVAGALVPALANLPQISEINVLCFQAAQNFSKYQLSDKLTIWYFKGQRSLNLPTRSFLDLVQAWHFVQKFSPSIVHGEGIGFMGDIATTISPNSVVTAHGVIHVEAQKALGQSIPDRTRIFLIKRMVRRVLKKAKVVISTSNYDANMLNQFIRGQRVTIHNPVRPIFFQNNWKESGNPYFIFAGLMHPRKNIEGLIRAFSKVIKHHPHAKLIITGPHCDEAYANTIVNLISNLKLENSIELLGLIDDSTLAKLLYESAGLVLFSWEETSPTIIAQAMASCKPVIAANVGGVSEMVLDAQTGFVISPGDEDGLSERMAELLSSSEMRKKMGVYANNIAQEHFQTEIVAAMTCQAYELALQGS